MDIPPPIPNPPLRFMDQFRAFIRGRNLAYQTEKTYTHWVRRYILFHGKQHPSTLTEPDIEKFLSHLAVQRSSSINTQRTALNALIFLYREFLGVSLDSLQFESARKPRKLPTVFTHEEALALIDGLKGMNQLVARLMYGAGLRVNEALRLRVKDIDFGMQQIVVRSGKGNKDRTTLLPESLVQPLRLQINYVLALHEKDLAEGFGEVYLPFALARKYPSAPSDPAWQYLFPAPRLSIDPRSGKCRRHHLLAHTVQRAVSQAIRSASIHKHANSHALRHSFATRLLVS